MSLIYEVAIKVEPGKASELKDKIINELEFDIASSKDESDEILIIWSVSNDEGVHEIEEALHYILNDGELGSYECFRIK